MNRQLIEIIAIVCMVVAAVLVGRGIFHQIVDPDPCVLGMPCPHGQYAAWTDQAHWSCFDEPSPGG